MCKVEQQGTPVGRSYRWIPGLGLARKTGALASQEVHEKVARAGRALLQFLRIELDPKSMYIPRH